MYGLNENDSNKKAPERDKSLPNSTHHRQGNLMKRRTESIYNGGMSF